MKYQPFIVACVLACLIAGCAYGPKIDPTSIATSTTTSSGSERALFDGDYSYIGTLDKKTPLWARLTVHKDIVRGEFGAEKMETVFSLDGSLEGDVLALDAEQTGNRDESFPPSILRLNIAEPGKLVGSITNRMDGTSSDITLYEVNNTTTNHSAYGGHYVLKDNPAQFIDLLFLGGTDVKIQAHAEWQGVEPSNIHVGDVDAFTEWHGGDTLTYRNDIDDCKLEMKFENEALRARDNGECGGVNVSFEGEYARASTTIPSWSLFTNFYSEGAI